MADILDVLVMLVDKFTISLEAGSIFRILVVLVKVDIFLPSLLREPFLVRDARSRSAVAHVRGLWSIFGNGKHTSFISNIILKSKNKI